jgi:hypothetical protein
MEAKVRKLVAFTWYEGKKLKYETEKNYRNCANCVSCSGGIIFMFPAI